MLRKVPVEDRYGGDPDIGIQVGIQSFGQDALCVIAEFNGHAFPGKTEDNLLISKR